MKKLLIHILILLAVSVSARAFTVDSLQLRYRTYTTWCSPEKLYLHIDRTYYAAGETMWFMGYLKDACSNSVQKPSNFIYVELLDKDGGVVSRVKVKRDSTGFPGHLKISDEIRSGDYTLRAYTLWQMNASVDYMFTQKIKIIGTEGAAKGIQMLADSIDVYFFPEGGRYFNNIRTKIAFKAMDNHGRSVKLVGCIKDEIGSSVLPVATVHDGMGAFSFTPVTGHRYWFEDIEGRRFPLPPSSTEGGCIGLARTSDSYIVRATALSGKVCTILARDSDNILPLAQIPADGIVRSFSFKKSFLKPGVNHLLLVDDFGNILSERLFFVYDEQKNAKLRCDFSAGSKGLISTHIEIKDSLDTPVNARLSMSVVRGSFQQYIQDDNLVSYMNLTSELRGRINSPSHYFDESVDISERERDMDLLMMTQGWRYYDIKKIFSPESEKFSITYLREYIQTLKGHIVRPTSKKMPQNYIFTLMIPKQKFNKFMDVAKANRFTIDSLDFEEGTEFIISCTREGFGADFIPKWSGNILAPEHKYTMASGSTDDLPPVQNIPLVSEIAPTDTLQAAVLTVKPDHLIGESLDARRVSDFDFKTYWDKTIVEYLSLAYPTFEYDGEVMYNTRFRGSNFGYGMMPEDIIDTDTGSNKRGLVKLVEDGSTTPWWVYDQIHMDEIKAMSVSTLPDPFYSAEGGVVMIKILPGGRRSTERKESILYFVPLGYQKPSQFYSPRYDLGDDHTEFDHRNTIFWSPSVEICDGTANVEFCDTDQQDYPYTVILQGYTSDGQPIFCRSTLMPGK